MGTDLLPDLDTAGEAVWVEQLEKRGETARVAVVRGGGEEQAVLESAGEITDGTREVGLDLVVSCECKKSRGMYETTVIESNPLGTCRGARPWLGRNTSEDCKLPSRLLIRTASNAYFPQVVSVLSLPERGMAVQTVVAELWDDLQIVDSVGELAVMKKKPKIMEKLAPFTDEEVLEAIRDAKTARTTERPVKQVELEALLAAPEGFGMTCRSIRTSTPAGCPTGPGVAPNGAPASKRSSSFTGYARSWLWPASRDSRR